VLDEERPNNLSYLLVLKEFPDSIASNNYEFIVLCELISFNFYRKLYLNTLPGSGMTPIE
jgi:hypothetical protein